MRKNTMTREKAIEILMDQRDWNKYGAEEIVNTLEEEGLLDTMSESDLLYESWNNWED